MSKRVRVLFVAGPARSGSTLLGRMLARLAGFVCVGELRFIWDRGFAKNMPCGCGQPFGECEFWRAVILKAFGGYEAVSGVFRSFQGEVVRPGQDVEARPQAHAMDRPHRIPHMLFPLKLPGYWQTLHDYQDILSRLYRAIQQVSGADCIIDTSKEPSTAFLLSTLPQVELHIVHLVRDSRAVAFSHLRKKIRPEITERQVHMVRWSPLQSAVGWMYRNLAAEALRLAVSGSARRFTDVNASSYYMRVRYEDLMANPDETLCQILRPLGATCEGLDRIVKDSQVQLGLDHTVWGNPMRFQQGAIGFHADVGWQRQMRAKDRLLVELMTFPLLWRYGYVGRRK